ncbi:U11/U12 small nuclear ribonucleoprotein isoform X2 [Tasmannia lanceolata]|uniref:U11/U12 small nuclear ribonucleoprotein isoform X2 n=1 Tax=Tasmannia lanceolata TaxID=3420 RepID=UPI004064253E
MYNNNLQSLPPNQNPNNPPSFHFPNLNDLINLAQNTITSITSNLFPSPNPNPNSLPNSNFISCPFDSNHKMPSESLFHHSLICPKSPGGGFHTLNDLSLLLNSLHYPNSLKPQSKLPKQQFLQPLLESDADLCFSLDEFGDFGSNFFYKDCPGVFASSSQLDSADKTFTLPGILSIECANFIISNGEIKGFSGEGLGILPSELWAVRSEVDLWSDFPFSYSYSVLRVALCLRNINEFGELKKWVISNSPRYGIVIDVPMRDHIFMLLKLCLKAISREAIRSLELFFSRDLAEVDGFLNRSMSFGCPRLGEVLIWLVSQLSVLYGETNGKFFTINMIKQCLLSAASCSLLFPFERRAGDAATRKETSGNVGVAGDVEGYELSESKLSGDGKLKELADDALCGDKNELSCESGGSGLVFVSQVAAAIAALHERSMLEARIKELRFGGSLSRLQLISEHSYVSMRANEERRKRPNYRPLLEHDGLLWQQYHNQDHNKSKTREELLAEERDYKRRRMSYRGKKGKRTAKQVIRDIIEEHMEEIKQAGGIGCFVKGVAEKVPILPGSVPTIDMTENDELKSSGRESHVYVKQFHSNYNTTFTRPEHEFPKAQSNTRSSMENAHHHDSWDDRRRSTSKETREREYSSRSPHSYKSNFQSRGQHGHRRERGDVERDGDKYERNRSSSSHKSKYRDNRSFSTASDVTNDLPESKDRHRDRTYRDRRSESVTQNMFEDRYDPSGSHDSPTEDVKYDKERQRFDDSIKGHHRDHRKKS